MGFDKGSITFRRYAISGWKHGVVDDAMLGALAADAFGRYGSADEKIDLGWITPAHLFDVDFAADKIEFGRFAHFRLRVDRNTIPGAILQSYVLIEELAALEASGRDKLSKQDRAEAKLAAKLRAEKEAKSGAYRRIGSYPVLVDLENAVLFVGHGGNAINERVVQVFCDTFDVQLIALDTQSIAARWADRLGDARALEDAKPCHLTSPPEGVDGDAFGLDSTDRSFLGREFLTWTWYRTAASEGLMPLAGDNGTDGDNELAAAVVKLLQLQCDFNLTGSASIRADGPAELPESKVALAHGKQPSKLGLILGSGRDQWTFSLGADLGVSGLTLEPSESDDPIDRLTERLDAVADLGQLIDRLFGSFLKIRLSSDWTAELGRMIEWASPYRMTARPPAPRLARA